MPFQLPLVWVLLAASGALTAAIFSCAHIRSKDIQSALRLRVRNAERKSAENADLVRTKDQELSKLQEAMWRVSEGAQLRERALSSQLWEEQTGKRKVSSLLSEEQQKVRRETQKLQQALMKLQQALASVKSEKERADGLAETLSSMRQHSVQPDADLFECCCVRGDVASCSVPPDVEFVILERRIPAHSFILKLRSEYFRTMLSAKMRESASGRIDVAETSAQAVLALLRFLYTGDLKVEANNEEAAVEHTLLQLLEVMRVGHRYRLLRLVDLALARVLQLPAESVNEVAAFEIQAVGEELELEALEDFASRARNRTTSTSRAPMTSNSRNLWRSSLF